MASFGELLGREIRERREARGWTQLDLALRALGDENADRRIRDYETGKVARPQARIYQPICDALGISRLSIGELKAQSGIAQEPDETAALIVSLKEELGSLELILEEVETLNRGQLIALATEFGVRDAHKLSNARLIVILKGYAEKYARTREEIGKLQEERDRIQRVIDELEESSRNFRFGSIDQLLTSMSELPRLQLQALAVKFEMRSAFNATDSELLEFLTEKACDYRVLKAEVEAIDDSLKRISNLKSAARAANEAGDFCKSEEILSRILEIELDESAKAAELSAKNALLLGRTEQAFRILSSAADSFAAVDPVQASERRLAWEDLLYAHGLRYGSNVMIHAAQMIRDALDLTDRETHPHLWGRAQNNLGNALRNQGSRTDGPASADLLDQAVAAYRAALEVRTRDAHPVDWAMTQNNLAIALQTQGSRTDGPEGADLLAQAVTAYRAALEIRTRDAHPVDWAQTQNNLGNALKDQAIRTDGPAGADLLAQAVAAFQAAHEVTTRDAHPVQWAMTQNNLGTALQNQGSRTDGTAGADLLAQAVDAFRNALKVRTRGAHLVQWAMTQANLALTEEARADHGTCTDPRPHLDAALTHITAALEVYDPIHMPYDYGTATKLKSRIDAKRAARDRA